MTEIKIASSYANKVVLIIDGDRYDLEREEALKLAQLLLTAVDDNDLQLKAAS